MEFTSFSVHQFSLMVDIDGFVVTSVNGTGRSVSQLVPNASFSPSTLASLSFPGQAAEF